VREELQRDRTLELDILSFINDPHPAPADLFDDPVLAGDQGLILEDLNGRFQRGRTDI
jgi:hypothetical protein